MADSEMYAERNWWRWQPDVGERGRSRRAARKHTATVMRGLLGLTGSIRTGQSARIGDPLRDSIGQPEPIILPDRSRLFATRAARLRVSSSSIRWQTGFVS